jgi:hypothetical protein
MSLNLGWTLYSLVCEWKMKGRKTKTKSFKNFIKKTKWTNDLLYIFIMFVLGASISWVRWSLEVNHEVCSKFYDPTLAKKFVVIILVFVIPILFLNKWITTLFWFFFSFIFQKC